LLDPLSLSSTNLFLFKNLKYCGIEAMKSAFSYYIFLAFKEFKTWPNYWEANTLKTISSATSTISDFNFLLSSCLSNSWLWFHLADDNITVTLFAMYTRPKGPRTHVCASKCSFFPICTSNANHNLCMTEICCSLVSLYFFQIWLQCTHVFSMINSLF